MLSGNTLMHLKISSRRSKGCNMLAKEVGRKKREYESRKD
jgi:hypothetical protein